MMALLIPKLFRLLTGVVAISISFQKPVLALTIQEAFENATKVDPTLRASRYNLEANNENIAIARSRLLPQINLQGSTNQLTQTTTQDASGNLSISKSFTGPSVNQQFVIRQGLVRPKEIYAVNFAELQWQYGNIKYQSDLSDLWLRVAYAWIDLVGSGQLVEAYESPLVSLHDVIIQESAKLTRGEGTKDALVEAEAQYEMAKANHFQAEQTYKAKQRSFELLTQMEFKSLEGKKLNLEPREVFSEKDRDQLWATAREKSFDLRLAYIQQQLQRERVRMARSDHLPTLDALATWNAAKNDATSTQGYKYKNHQIGIQYLVPIYTGGATSAAERQAALSVDASIAEEEAASIRLDADFQILWSAWVGQRARVQAGFKLLQSSVEQLRASQMSQLHGIKTLSDVAYSKLVLSRRLADQINFVMEYQKYSIRLYRSDITLQN